MIHFDRFGWRFADASGWALRDVSLEVRRGEFVTIAGPSGSGKTTLAMAMCGLLIGRHDGQTQGSVQVNSQDVSQTPLYQTAETIGLVQQNPETHFATLTVHDELAFGMENRCLSHEEIRHNCTKALDLLSITHLRDRSLATLSGGEKQRVAVASLVAGMPEVLVLDEPTASLDPEASRDLFHALADLCRRAGLTVVIIEHKLAQLLPLKPRLICVEGGRVVKDAPAGCGVDDTYPGWLMPRDACTDGWVAHGFSRGGHESANHAILDMSGVRVELEGHTILEDISLRVGPGEVVAILGPNGGGKSTLLQVMLGLVKPVSGFIRVCGMEVSPKAVSRLARHVGVVFQNADHQLVAESVWDEALFTTRNLKLVEDTTRQEADRLLEQAGLSDRKSGHPFRLSWGQKRRLNLISAILHRPQLLLLDEPFAGQDWENVALLLEAIGGALGVSGAGPVAADSESNRGACLMVTHDPRVVLRSCTRLLFVSKGRVVVDAPVPEAFDRLLEIGHDAYVPG
ncbi:MAG: ATP-binding cassette domain-containing protein [Phycisphaerae bacterium]|nr:ATP-binding cassette domain-containing protein [Phycisphaerae bacterium]